MSDLSFFIELAAAGLVGFLLGLFFFGGLWLTVRVLPTSRAPALLMLGSFVVRVAFTVAGFYLVMGDRWERVLACMAGFLAARLLLVYSLKPADNNPVPGNQGEPWK